MHLLASNLEIGVHLPTVRMVLRSVKSFRAEREVGHRLNAVGVVMRRIHGITPYLELGMERVSRLAVPGVI